MSLKKAVSLVLSMSLLAPGSLFASQASFHSENDQSFVVVNDGGEDQGPQVCSAPNSSLELNQTCDPFSTVENQSVENLEQTSQALSSSEPPLCGDQDLDYGDKPLSKEEKLQIKKDLLKECNKAFKKHKRAFAKQLFKNGRIFKALRALMQKKKKLKHLGHFNKPYSVAADGESLEEVNRKIAEEEERIINEIKTEFPGGFDESDPYYKDNGKLFKGKYSYGVDGKMSSPSHIYINDNDRTCKMDVELPEVDDVDLPPSNLIPPLDITDSFPDDCAFMVSDQFSERDALKMLGTSNRSDYCSNNQTIDKSDHVKKDKNGKTAFDYLNTLSDSFAQAAEDGLNPNFTLNVSRNLYADETKPLAEKRGEFIQKYMFAQLSQKVQNQEKETGTKPPAWATDFNEFQKVFKLQYPAYDGLATVGDFGPNPMAKAEEFEGEKANLKTTLDKRVTEINKDIAKIEDKNSGTLKILNGQISKLEKDKLELERQRNVVQNQIENQTDFKKANELVASLNDLTSKLYQTNYELAKAKRDLDQEKQLLTHHKSKLAKNNPAQQVKLLDEFYKNRPESFDRSYKNQWDDKLFKNFKMVAIEGTFDGQKEDDIEMNDEVTPKIHYTINNVIKAEAFTCDYKIKNAKSRSLDWKKGNFRWGRAAGRWIWNPIWVSAKFTVGFGWLVGLIGAGKKLTTTSCPNFSGSAFGRYMRWGNTKKRSVGKLGGPKVHTNPIEYNGDYSVWPEAQDAFNK